MKNILKIFFRDLKKIFTNSMAIILAVGIALLPSLYAWFNIYANWDPYGKTGNMMVAVINNDEGASYKDLTIDIGDEIVKNLKSNDAIDWQFVSKSKAIHGVEAGEYYAAIEIPKEFSKSLTSIVTSNFEQPKITYYANEKKNAIATKITDKVVQTVQTEVNESFVTTVINMINRLLGTAVEENKISGVNIFETLKNEIATTQKSISAIQKTLDSFSSVMGLVEGLNTSLSNQELSSLLENTGNLIDSTQDVVAVGQNALKVIISTIGTVVDDSSSKLVELAKLVDKAGTQSADEAIKTLKDVGASLANVKEGIDHVATILKTVNDGLPTPIGDINKLVEKINSASADLTKIINKIDTVNKDNYLSVIKDISAKLDGASKMMLSVKSDYKNKIQKPLQAQVTSLVKTLGDLSNVIVALDKDKSSIGTLTDALKKSVKAGDTMISSLGELISTANKQLTGLSEKIDALSKSQVVNAIVNITDGNSDDLGSFIACPVQVNTEHVYGIENYGSAMAPFYSTLAIWVGGMFLVALIKVDVKKKNEIGNVKPYQEYFGRGLLFVAFAIIQSIIICIGDLYFLKIQCYHPGKFIFAGVVAGVIYSMFIYSLTYCFGDIGKAIGVILLVVQIGGSGGTFPIDVTPTFFRTINPYLPFTFIVEAMRECICGTYENYYWIYLLKLCAYLGVSLIVGLLFKKIIKNPVRFFEKKIEETGLF